MIVFLLSGCNRQTSTSFEEKSNEIAFRLELQENEDINGYQSYRRPILINLGVTRYCATCAQIQPEIRALYKDVKEKVIIKDIDLETYPKFKKIYSLKKIPTQIFIPVNKKASFENLSSFKIKEIKRNGNLIYLRHEGFLSKDDMKTVLMQLGIKKD